MRRGADGRDRRPGAGRARGLRARGDLLRRGHVQARGAACASTSGFRRAAVRPHRRGLRVAFSRAFQRTVTVDVLRHSRGARVTSARRVKRFAGRARSFTWRWRGGAPRAAATSGAAGMRLPGGGADERGFVLERCAAGARRAPRGGAALLLPRLHPLRAGSPVFGGTTRRKLSVRYALARTARTRVELLRGRKVVRTLAGTPAGAAGRLRALTLRPRTVPRGRYRVRLVIRRAGVARSRSRSSRAGSDLTRARLPGGIGPCPNTTPSAARSARTPSRAGARDRAGCPRRRNPSPPPRARPPRA